MTVAQFGNDGQSIYYTNFKLRKIVGRSLKALPGHPNPETPTLDLECGHSVRARGQSKSARCYKCGFKPELFTTPTKETTMTLLDFANDRQNVILFYVSFGHPTGEDRVMGHPEMNFAEDRDLGDLEGTVDADGTWNWDGEGNPTDEQRNTITRIQAFENAETWTEIAAEYDEAGV